jgi:hypothetical protein
MIASPLPLRVAWVFAASCWAVIEEFAVLTFAPFEIV